MENLSFWPMGRKGGSFFSRFIKFYLILLLIFGSFIFGLISGRQTYKVVNDSSLSEKQGNVFNKKEKPEFLSKDVDFGIFWDSWKIIEENYVKQPVNEPELFYGAIAGSVAALQDPHSVFFDPKTTESFTQELQGSFYGVGLEIAIKKDRLTVVAALPGTPAEKAGIKSGDKIMAIDGEDTTGIFLDYAVNKIRGPKGTEVNLTISRDEEKESKEYKLVREKIQIQSVKWKMLDNNIVHLELRYFNEDTMDDFNKAILEITAKNPKGIIFDLRNNPGGFLDTAVNVASEWIENNVIVYEKMSNGDLKEYKGKGQARLKNFPTIVLVNGGSASGSEIVAGALKDYKIATLVGEKTFGKGSVQSLFPLKDGSSIKLTIAQWLTPNENLIDNEGIDPDIEVKLSDEDFNQDKDPQLDKAIDLLLQK